MNGPSPAFEHPAFRLTARGISVERGGRRLIDGLDFAVGNGDALLLTGRNGAGKSSLLRALAGLLPLAGGTLDFTGGDELRSAYLGHALALKPQQSAAANLRFWCGLRGQGDAAIIDALDALGLNGLGDIPVRLLSEGQRRRVGLARIAASGAGLWLLDEPATALDAETKKRLDRLINHHLSLGGAVVAATHGALELFGARTINLGGVEPGLGL